MSAPPMSMTGEGAPEEPGAKLKLKAKVVPPPSSVPPMSMMSEGAPAGAAVVPEAAALPAAVPQPPLPAVPAPTVPAPETAVTGATPSGGGAEAGTVARAADAGGAWRVRIAGDRRGRVCRLPEVLRGASAAPTQAGCDQQARPGPQEGRGFAHRAGPSAQQPRPTATTAKPATPPATRRAKSSAVSTPPAPAVAAVAVEPVGPPDPGRAQPALPRIRRPTQDRRLSRRSAGAPFPGRRHLHMRAM